MSARGATESARASGARDWHVEWLKSRSRVWARVVIESGREPTRASPVGEI